MVVVGRIKKGAYFDSVTLMNVARELSHMEGVADAAVVMGTNENRAILAAADLLTPEFEASGDTDLLIGVRADTDGIAEAALIAVDRLLENVQGTADDGEAFVPKSLDGALDVVPGANLALISVAGRYAGDVAARALDRGLHVMLFSDNVPLETEVELKARAHSRGLLVMGPDCGTAIINGVPLGFANAVNRGPIGIIAASGTGLQEVSTLVSNLGSGISQAIGTGGHDVVSAVGGITFLDGLEALVDDAETEVIVLVSKPPDSEVLDRIRKKLAKIRQPVVSVFLGTEPEGPNGCRTLAEAAFRAVTVALGSEPEGVRGLLLGGDDQEKETVERIVGERSSGQRYVRALMSGGTFASEAEIVFAGIGLNDVHSNVSSGRAAKLDDPLRSVANTIVDLGSDEFTVGRPHPMIDYSLRVKRIVDEANDPEVAVILLDVVLGYGSNLDPASELDDAVREAVSKVAVVCSITGTDRDPQNRRAVRDALEGAGAVIAESNLSACRIAGLIARKLGVK